MAACAVMPLGFVEARMGMMEPIWVGRWRWGGAKGEGWNISNIELEVAAAAVESEGGRGGDFASCFLFPDGPTCRR
jgi:hypothetical protein